MLVFSFPNSTSFHLCSIHSWRLQNLFPAWLLSSWQPKKRWRATVKSLPKNCWKWFLYLGLKVFRSHRRSASSSGLHRRTIGDLWSFSCLFPVVTKHCFVPKLFYYLGSKAVAVFFSVWITIREIIQFLWPYKVWTIINIRHVFCLNSLFKKFELGFLKSCTFRRCYTCRFCPSVPWKAKVSLDCTGKHCSILKHHILNSFWTILYWNPLRHQNSYVLMYCRFLKSFVLLHELITKCKNCSFIAFTVRLEYVCSSVALCSQKLYETV